MKTKWYGVYTRAAYEKKVADSLNRKNIENYLPTKKTKSQWNFRNKIIEQPLFPSYVFVKTSEEKLEFIKNLEGVINLLYWLEEPVVISECEIEAIKTILIENLVVGIQKTEIDFRKINGGPNITYSQDGAIKTFNVELPSIGYNMVTKIEAPRLTIISRLQKEDNPADITLLT